MIGSAASEAYAWLAGRADWYQPSRGDLALVGWWQDVQQPGPAVIIRP